MKILFILGKFPVLTETFILNQITGLLDRGHEVDIYAAHEESSSFVHPDIDQYNLSGHAYYRGMPAKFVPRLLKGLALLGYHFKRKPDAFLRSLNIFKYGRNAASLRLFYEILPVIRRNVFYDIIHCHFGSNGIRGEWLRELDVIKGKLVTSFHGYDMSKYLQSRGQNTYDWLFSRGDKFLPISQYWEKSLIQLGCNKDKIAVHRMGIDCSRFFFVPKEQPHDGYVNFVSVARLVEKKGLQYSIRGFARLSKDHPNIRYTIIGEGPLRDSLERLVQQLNLGKIVQFVGWKQQDEVIEILNKSQILVVPSVTTSDGDQEGIPVVLMEAMAMGFPVVSTIHSGIPELVKNGASGFLVPEKDVDALVDKIKHLIEHPELWPEMGYNGRRHVEEHYDINKLNDKLVGIYQDLLEPQGL